LVSKSCQVMVGLWPASPSHCFQVADHGVFVMIRLTILFTRYAAWNAGGRQEESPCDQRQNTDPSGIAPPPPQPCQVAPGFVLATTRSAASALPRVTCARPSCAIGVSGITIEAMRSLIETIPLIVPSSSTSKCRYP